MVGQKALIELIDTQISMNTYPRFSIIAGNRGSGKKTLANNIAHKLSDTVVNITSNVDGIRDMISEAYKVSRCIVYIISDADDMSLSAKNAMLKVTEEVPNNAYIIMTVEDENNILDTIRSRACVYTTLPYTYNDLAEYVESIHRKELSNMNIILDVCDTPGEIDTLIESGVVDLYDYVNKVIDNIALVSIANALKIANKVSLKSDADGYDLKLFWKMFCHICMQKGCVNVDNSNISNIYLIAMLLTSDALSELRIKSINRQMLMDKWIISIREVWS